MPANPYNYELEKERTPNWTTAGASKHRPFGLDHLQTYNLGLLMSHEEIEKLVEPYLDLPLECDGMTRVISYLLNQHQVEHQVCTCEMWWNGQIMPHWFIRLPDRHHIDYRLRMWYRYMLDEFDIPHGIFAPNDYPDFEYRDIRLGQNETSEVVFKVLTRLTLF